MTKPTVTIGNVYGHGFDAERVAQVERLGFSLRPQLGHYAGSQDMRFIDFAHGPALELIHVGDPKAYADFVPAGMVPYCPGISLLLPEATVEDLESFEERFAELRPYRHHANYDGSRDLGKPGWTYLNFGVPVVPNTFTYLTTLDEPRPVAKKVVDHPNRVRGVRGLLFDLEARDLGRLASLARTKPVRGAFRIGDAWVWSRSSFAGAFHESGKSFPLRAMVLEAEDLESAPLRSAGLASTSFDSEAALRCTTNPLSWDLIFVE